MKKYLILWLVWAWSHSCVAAINHAFISGLGEARTVVLGQEGLDEGMWSEFITHIQSTGFYGQLATNKRQTPEAFRGQLTAEFDHWRSNKLVADHEGLDDDVRGEFRPDLDDSTASYSESETATIAGAGSGAGGASVASSKMTQRSALHSVGSPDRSFTRTDLLLKELDKLRRDGDLEDKAATDARAAALGDAEEVTREANLKAFLDHDALRASYIKVLLSDATHREEILRAIVEGAHYGDFRAALIRELLAHEPTRASIVDLLHDHYRPQLINKIHAGGNWREMITKLHGDDASRGEVIDDLLVRHLDDLTARIPGHDAFRAAVITALLGDAPHRDAIAGDFVGNDDFRAVLIGLLEAGHRDAVITALLGDAPHRDAIAGDFVGNDDFRGVLIGLLGTGHAATMIDTLRGTQLAPMITSLLTHHLDPVIQALIADAPNRNTIAQAFVDSPAFRAVLIRLLEAGRHAIGIGRMLWHLIDGTNGATFFGDATAQIVTKAAFDHLLLKTRDGYQSIASFTGQKGNFRAAFAAGNQVGKNGIHLGSSHPS